jgi:hypothetical protein
LGILFPKFPKSQGGVFLMIDALCEFCPLHGKREKSEITRPARAHTSQKWVDRQKPRQVSRVFRVCPIFAKGLSVAFSLFALCWLFTLNASKCPPIGTPERPLSAVLRLRGNRIKTARPGLSRLTTHQARLLQLGRCLSYLGGRTPSRREGVAPASAAKSRYVLLSLL